MLKNQMTQGNIYIYIYIFCFLFYSYYSFI
ncbi:hypothetical protein PFFCH_04448 [Plasmodium falciparum FCH/4]|uniref:Uncharacterized protein n=1 Tax=Plasmodium falciparum FCH/4 TaxID=1036724 RepID=A0A024VHW0_PLAFA|nr:hypothetical protein PFFCH_04448 [Plasmodium falciparum FCH/4]